MVELIRSFENRNLSNLMARVLRNSFPMVLVKAIGRTLWGSLGSPPLKRSLILALLQTGGAECDFSRILVNKVAKKWWMEGSEDQTSLSLGHSWPSQVLLEIGQREWTHLDQKPATPHPRWQRLIVAGLSGGVGKVFVCLTRSIDRSGRWSPWWAHLLGVGPGFRFEGLFMFTEALVICMHMQDKH